MKRSTGLAALCVVLLSAGLLLSLSGMPLPDSRRDTALLNDQVPEGYSRLLISLLSDHPIEFHYNKTLTHLLDSRIAMMQAEDARVVPRLENGLKGQFVPHYQSTIVLVMPKDMREVRAFSDLADASCRLFVSRRHIVRILPSMALALGKGERLEEAVALLVRLKAEGRLIIAEHPRDYVHHLDGNTLTILPDDEAARLILSGLPLEMHVPTDGTYRFINGLYVLSESPDDYALSEEALVKAGVRTLSGQALPGLYPDAGEYEHAYPALADDRHMDLARASAAVFRRRILGQYRFSTADGSERVTLHLPLAILVLLWGISLSWRLVDNAIRRLLQFQTAFLLLWLLIIFLKPTSDPMLNRYLWYLFYAPLIGSATLLFLVSRHMPSSAGPVQPPRTGLATKVTSAMLLAAILSNDIHQLVFGFPSGLPRTDPYLHRIGFFAVAAWILLLVLGGLFRLYRLAGTRRNLRFIGMLSVLIAGATAYNILYVAGVPAIRQTQMGPIHILFILLLWELTLRSGLIPYNRHYLRLFASSRIPLYLLDSDGRMCRHSNGASPLTATTGYQDANQDYAYESADITGGHIVWKNDLREVRQLQSHLQSIRNNLVRQTALLEKQAEQERTSLALTLRRGFLEQLDARIRPRLNHVAAQADRLSATMTEAERISLLRDIIATIGDCKRTGLLHLHAASDGQVQTRLLVMLMKENCADMVAGGMETGVFGDPDGRMALREAVLCLDFCHDLLTLLTDCPTGSIFLHAGNVDAMPVFNFLCDLPSTYAHQLATFAIHRQPLLEEQDFLLKVVPEEPSLRLMLQKKRGNLYTLPLDEEGGVLP